MSVYHALLAAVPVDSEKSAKQRTNSWKQYLNSLDLEKLKKKAEDKKKPLKQLRGLVPFNIGGAKK